MNQSELTDYVQNRTITLPDGTRLPQLGQGTWHMGEQKDKEDDEIYALQTGIDAGMTLIDTAEMYGNGGAEKIVGKAIESRRDDVFLVSKVFPHNAGGERLINACEQSLQRLGTETIDLYLLHWRGGVPLRETIDGMEQLKREGKIQRWGVSNLDKADIEELLALPNGENCTVNQVLYHLGSRGIEYDLLPRMRRAGMPAMAYCPLAQAGRLGGKVHEHSVVQSIANEQRVDPLQILLAWVVQASDIFAIPKTDQSERVWENARAAAINLTNDELARLDAAFPPPSTKQPLDIV
ncbi:diketogulonate reductase-like aldo/keto reductase [Salsuginibacillus halophilus]|uniref:Diketogulonate reductase-like aldo/keto reductase n=1 Tax=Salsuginibacillus halophilus TaxID=517424 RepID=A0A2P8H3L8_9BACI|nr:diketogulonate reductase-like aldo/keto reductase [Salsuginibacillus halophilus]